MNTWWRKSPFSARRHLHLRRLAGLPLAAQPEPDVGRHPGRPRVAPAADRAGAAGVVPAALPALQGRLHDLPRARRSGYAKAAAQGSAEADKNAADAMAYGIGPGSTIWYDLEGFDLTNTSCRESALVFVSSWVSRIKAQGYVAGFYSSASSGIKMLDDARTQRPGQFALPDRIWIARWDGAANTSTTYIPDDGWRPGGRMKQYLGGHNETWGEVTINIDSNYVDLGAGSVPVPEGRCPGTRLGFWKYPSLSPASAQDDPGQGPAVPAHRAGHLLRRDQRHLRRGHHRGRPQLAGVAQVHPDRHVREAALDRTAVGRRAYDDQARLGRRVGPPAPAGAQRGRGRAVPGDRRLRRQDRVGAAHLPVAPADRGLRGRDAADLEQAPAGPLARSAVAPVVPRLCGGSRTSRGVQTPRSSGSPAEPGDQGRTTGDQRARPRSRGQAGGPTTSATPVSTATASRPTARPRRGRRSRRAAIVSTAPRGASDRSRQSSAEQPGALGVPLEGDRGERRDRRQQPEHQAPERPRLVHRTAGPSPGSRR